MTASQVIPPVVGSWFSGRDGLFEVVAIDEADGTIEIQYHDGSLEELEMQDWAMRCKAGTLRPAEQPEDFTGAIDVEAEDEPLPGTASFDMDGALNARSLGDFEDLDLFE
jgi:hypothetical protein